jgi:hypothetical protein
MTEPVAPPVDLDPKLHWPNDPRIPKCNQVCHEAALDPERLADALLRSKFAMRPHRLDALQMAKSIISAYKRAL